MNIFEKDGKKLKIFGKVDNTLVFIKVEYIKYFQIEKDKTKTIWKSKLKEKAENILKNLQIFWKIDKVETVWKSWKKNENTVGTPPQLQKNLKKV